MSLSHSCAERSRIKLATVTWESGDFMFEEVERKRPLLNVLLSDLFLFNLAQFFLTPGEESIARLIVGA